MSELTIELNDKVYEVNEKMRSRIERRAEREFEENWMLDYYWGANERGDPILYIETEGKKVPWDRLEKLEFEMQEVEKPSGDDSDDSDKEELDNGNGVKSVPRDDVDMDTPDVDPTDSEQGEESPPDTKFMVTHPSKNYVPQPEDDDPAKLPPDPEELPKDPTLVTWLPDDGREEVWSTGTALVSTSVFLEWNLQLKADEVVDNATKIVDDGEGHVMEVPKTHNHDEWQKMAEDAGCAIVKEKKQKQETPTEEQQRGYSGREADEPLDGKYGGNNFHV